MHTLNVLVVEDVAPLRRLMKALLQRRDGVNVRAVGTVKEALAQLEEWSPDGALVDRTLPDGRGEQVLHALAEKHPQAVRVLMTGDRVSPETELPLPGVTVLQKPFTAEALGRWINTLRSG
ncbi:MAG: response regulator [Sandaracinaceae bacterium]